ncbi:hypothetical protein OY671_008357 [Metschnikowia pulcherrima]|nr:hypothetical protein OY671_008357 [Metschnikowia pulcherrima]
MTSQDHPSTGIRIVSIAAMTSIVSTACALSVYDRFVRDPRTPRLGTVDIGQIFAANQAVAIKKSLSGSSNMPADASGAQAGQDMSKQLQDFSRRCGCSSIASPAVVGSTRAVPDYTAAIKAAYGSTVDPAEFRVPVPQQGSGAGQLAPQTSPGNAP